MTKLDRVITVVRKFGFEVDQVIGPDEHSQAVVELTNGAAVRLLGQPAYEVCIPNEDLDPQFYGCDTIDQMLNILLEYGR